MTRIALALVSVMLLAACGAGDPPSVNSRVNLAPVWAGS